MATGGLVLLTDRESAIGGLDVELTRTPDSTTDEMRVHLSLSGVQFPAINPDLTLASGEALPRWHLVASGDFQPVRSTNPRSDLCRGQTVASRRGGRLIECRDPRRFAPKPFRLPDILLTDYTFEFGPTFGEMMLNPEELAAVDLTDPAQLADPFGFRQTRRSTLLPTGPGYDAERAAVISGAMSPIAVDDEGVFDITLVFRIRELPTASTTASSRIFRLPPISDAFEVSGATRGGGAPGPASKPSAGCPECMFAVTSDGERVGPPLLASKRITVTDLARPGERVQWSAPEPAKVNTLDWQAGVDEFELASVDEDFFADATMDAVQFELSDPGAATLASSQGFLAGALASGAVGLVVLLLQKALERLEVRRPPRPKPTGTARRPPRSSSDARVG